jgi:hypothetical protein
MFQAFTHNNQFNSTFEYAGLKRDEVEGIEALNFTGGPDGASHSQQHMPV